MMMMVMTMMVTMVMMVMMMTMMMMKEDDDYDDDVADTSQSPHPLVTTTPELSTAVAHQGVGESVYVHWWWVAPL